VLRSQAERILRTLAPDGACDPTDPESCCAARDRRAGKKKQPFERCLACRLFGNEEWASRLRLRVDRVEGGAPVPFDHVAIDRFTGGARDSLKFDALASRSARWAVYLDLTDVPEKDRPWARGLMALVLSDLHDGRVRAGHGAARGHGRLVLTRAPVFGEPLEPCVRALWVKLGVPWPGKEVAS
jgi:CRISPR/Cas system CSM-associated protein Csm3 (group 7 of RAMP superfamily)